MLAFIFAGDDGFISRSITALINGQFELRAPLPFNVLAVISALNENAFEIATGAMISETSSLLAAGCLWFEEPDGCVFLSA